MLRDSWPACITCQQLSPQPHVVGLLTAIVVHLRLSCCARVSRLVARALVLGDSMLDIADGIAGTQWGCADRVTQGSVPNEHGTWQYGRAGWCDGQQVTRPATFAASSGALPPESADDVCWCMHIDALLRCERAHRLKPCCCCQVDPWVVDVTDAALSAAGSGLYRSQRPQSSLKSDGRHVERMVEVSYRGLFRGREPPEATGNAYIMMESSLVIML